MRHIVNDLTAAKSWAKKTLQHLPRSAMVHAIAAAVHAAQGDHLEALVAICHAVASFRHR